MSCGCNDSGMITSWIDWAKTDPENPLDIIANAKLDNTQGVYLNSSTFSTPPNVWVATTIALTAMPKVTALGTDNLQLVADAEQWMLSHLMRNIDAKLAPPLQNVIFLRGGLQWENEISLALGGSYTDIQFSFRDNAGTRGDMSGTVPVISWTAAFSGTVKLKVTLNTYGHAIMGIRLIHGSDYSMYESEWIIVP